MDATPTSPEQQHEITSSIKNRHLPPEIIEEILSNLPLKSVVRFSSVSKSWNSMIFEPRFARKHKSRAALLRRDRLFMYISCVFDARLSYFYDLSSISSDLPIGMFIKRNLSFSSMFPDHPTINATDFSGQFEEKPCLRGMCNELWCVEVEGSLFLWNPSMRNYRKLPCPLFESQIQYESGDFLFGLGYDSVGDDYKILKIGRHPSTETELYSLKINSWRRIESFSAPPSLLQQRCEFVDGRFHWIGVTTTKTPIIVSFNLSTEKYGEVAQPEYSPAFSFQKDELEVVVVRGMLCACLNYFVEGRFVMWVMEEYGVEKSWIKKFDIHYSHSVAYFPAMLKPVYFYDNNDILIKFYDRRSNYMKIFMYKKEEARPTEIVSCEMDAYYYYADAFLYVESLISPAAPLLGYNE